MYRLVGLEFLAKMRMQELQREAERYRMVPHPPSVFARWIERRRGVAV